MAGIKSKLRNATLKKEVTKMTRKLDNLKKQIEVTKKNIENLTLSAMDALKSREYSFASKKVNEILDHENSLEELNLSYENELLESEKESYEN